MVGAEIEPAYGRTSSLDESTLQFFMDRLHIGLADKAAGNDRLIADDHQLKASFMQSFQRSGNTGEDPQLIGARQQMNILDQDPIAIKKDRGTLRRSLFHIEPHTSGAKSQLHHFQSRQRHNEPPALPLICLILCNNHVCEPPSKNDDIVGSPFHQRS